MQRNVGGLDRIVRAVGGTWLLAVALAAAIDGERTRAAMAAVAGAGLVWNAATRFCGGNYLLGVDTTRESRSTE